MKLQFILLVFATVCRGAAANNCKSASLVTSSMCAAQLSGMNHKYTRRESDIPTYLLDSLSDEVTLRTSCRRCNQGKRLYRTADGSCNNVRDPSMGQSLGSFQRLMPAQYGDGVCTPKTLGVNCGLLPTAREVSKAIHPALSVNAENTVMLMQWGEFMDHDMTGAAINQPHVNRGCCNHVDVQRGLPHPDIATCNGECFPIIIPKDDPYFNINCIEMVRSRAIQNISYLNSSNPREQQNLLTSYIDASNVYGTNEEHTKKLRAENGRMATSAGNLLPIGRDQDCILGPSVPHCFATGDERAHAYPPLTGLHTIFVRLHNIIVAELDENTNWGGNRLFQETRKIIGAILQKTTYFDWLPYILSPKTLKKNGLRRGEHKYDINVNARIASEFATAAYRMGHSLIPDFVKYGDEKILSRNLFNNPKTVFENLTLLMEGVINQPALARDRFITEEITDHLFETKNGSFDLVSFNINRGRDHAIATYNQMREYCGLRKLTSFYDKEVGNAGVELAKIYDHVDDIELFPGGMSEPNLKNSLLGETFNCILGEQFRCLKFGDAFWHETRDKRRGFSSCQRLALKRFSFAKILCDTLNFNEVQPDPFSLPNDSNNRVKPCSEYDKLNLSPWYDSEESEED
ncbi:hypothetical protein LOTGIDRAFT_238662 [Lottia gigantea]|uniref:Peroxidase n=1 Tax=Lottia gigantea TaxID=225164 RepID=V4B1N2_LOTGI|nr:hypothetical protein LOTGIDRAFT_238662 [Lottia gigantea]ESP00222.1 hypothetical protein LOTGIDRAFT_238662 [Lottia gigantea]